MATHVIIRKAKDAPARIYGVTGPWMLSSWDENLWVLDFCFTSKESCMSIKIPVSKVIQVTDYLSGDTKEPLIVED